jgi:NADPH-dependent 2,4-dienoyl-CoA reductase/sulfur reductase-like enzyme
MSYLVKGMGLLREIRAARVPRYTAATDLAVEGDDSARALRFRAGGQSVEIACDTVLLHHGVVPNTQAARSLGIAHRWDARQQAFVPIADFWGATDHPLVSVAGDGAGIGGAAVAEIAGRLSALAAAADLGAIAVSERDARAARFRRALAWQMAIRPFLDVAYPAYRPLIADDTIICRCEEVTAGAIRNAASLGCTGPNQAKAFVRAGMGPCQGRYCGLTVTQLLAEANGASPDATGYYRIRPPLKPVTLGELAAMETEAT